MIIVPEKQDTLMILSLSQDPHLTILDAELSAAGYTISLVNTLQHAAHILETEPVDAVISDDDYDATDFLEDMVTTADELADRPIVCILTTAPLPPRNTAFADIVLPDVPISFLDRQLRSYLAFRRRMIAVEVEHDEISLLKNAIVRNVSHELKTPLLQVKSAVALIAEDEVDENLSRMAVQATARLETVVKNITLLADSMNGSFGPILVRENVEHAMRNLRRIWIHKDAISRIDLQIDENLPPIHGDKQGLGIVLQQLMDNALKFSEGPVHVRAYREGSRVCIAVTDHGIGIHPDKIKQIFESFYQVDSSSTRRYGGSGVGLAIVRLIMEKHNVEIQVESTLDEGSTFSFSLPLATFS